MPKLVADHWRGLDFYKPDLDKDCNVLIVGAGSIGSYTAFGLARMGVKRITVVDYDMVEAHNLPNQFFSEDGMEESILKVTALARTIKMIIPSAEIKTFPMKIENFSQTDEYKSVRWTTIICAVDDMNVRKWMFENLRGWNLYLDARVGGLFANIYSISIKEYAFDYYRASLHSNEEAAQLPCSGQSIVDVSFAVSAELIGRYRTYAMSKRLPAIHTFHDYKIGQAYGMSFYREE